MIEIIVRFQNAPMQHHCALFVVYEHLVCIGPTWGFMSHFSCLQSRLPALRQRRVFDERRRAQGVPAVHHRMLVAAAGRTRQPAAATHHRAQSGRQRPQLPVRQHVRALPEAARVQLGGHPPRPPARRHHGEGLPFELMTSHTLTSALI